MIHVIRQYDFNLTYANSLVEDLNEEQMTTCPAVGLENHPAFTIGHLVTGSAMLAEDIGGNYNIPNGWKELFQRKGPGDPTFPDLDKNKYPTKPELTKELERQHLIVVDLLMQLPEEKLQEKLKWKFGMYMPTLMDVIIFMCVNHPAMHLGQLAAWRRSMGLPSVLAKV